VLAKEEVDTKGIFGGSAYHVIFGVELIIEAISNKRSGDIVLRRV
jgi:hypothetical protein